MISPRRPSNGVWRNEAQFSVAFLQVSFLWNFPKLVVGCVFSFLLEAGGFKSSFFFEFPDQVFLLSSTLFFFFFFFQDKLRGCFDASHRKFPGCFALLL